ncbi:MAG TPA: hypothetical protein VJ583_03460 [Nitrososphaeraceae archaeon]|nr:hypothetical protein [Nitrososphaeraceae archaeon]
MINPHYGMCGEKGEVNMSQQKTIYETLLIFLLRAKHVVTKDGNIYSSGELDCIDYGGEKVFFLKGIAVGFSLKDVAKITVSEAETVIELKIH